MKKKILLIIVAFVFLMTGCGKEPTGETGYHEITLAELNQKIENKESFVLVIGASTCSACATYKTYMTDVIKNYDVYVNYIDGGALTDAEKAEFLKIVYYISTPTTVYFVNGVLEPTHNRITGAASYDAIVEHFTKNGYIGN